MRSFNLKGLLGREVVEKKSATPITLTDAVALQVFGSTPAISGRSIDPATAMRVPAVRAAALLISEMCGTIPFKIYERDGDTKRVATDHPAYFLVHDEPNDEMGAEEFRAMLTLDAILTDAGYAFVNRVEGRAVEMTRLDPTKVKAKRNAAGELFYEYGSGRDARVFSRDDVLRIKAPGGVSPIKHAREAIALALELEACASRIFSKGGRPSGVLSFPNALGEDAAKRMSESWNAAHGGENTGRTAVLEEGGAFNQFTFSSVDTEFAAMRRYQVVEIARAFNVPPTMLMALENGTFANVEQLQLYFKTFSLAPWLSSWGRALGRALLSPPERDRFYVEAVHDALLAADTAARSESFAKLRAAGVLTANEARAAINLPAHQAGNDLTNPYTSSTTRDAA